MKTVEALQQELERLQLLLSIEKTQDELNKYAPTGQASFRITCPSCGLDHKHLLSIKYFYEKQ